MRVTVVKLLYLRVYNDSVTTIGRGNGAMFVLLDLSAAFDTLIMIICFAY